jgi:AcrR family transcriptional regulator
VSRAGYRSERRQEQAVATRQAIVEAARALFAERGYARTTVADIAAAAHVAVPTVYASVGPKPAILGELRKLIPVLADVPQDIESALGQLNDPAEVIAGPVAVIRRLMETSGDLMFAIEAAAPFEPIAAEAWEEGMALHRAAWAMAVRRLEALGALKQPRNAAKATDVLSFLSLPAAWRTLDHEYGWSYDHIEAWIVETALSLVVAPLPSSETREPVLRPRARSHKKHT